LIEELDGVQRHPVELRDKPAQTFSTFPARLCCGSRITSPVSGLTREFERDLPEDQDQGAGCIPR
jgi:hypothetical protein